MTEQEKVISQLCLEMQYYFEELCNAYCIEESYCMDRIEHCIEQIHRMVNPDFDKICEDVEVSMERWKLAAVRGGSGGIDIAVLNDALDDRSRSYWSRRAGEWEDKVKTQEEREDE